MAIKNIFFDFDGVILESVHVKTKAFRDLYLPYGDDIANKIVAHHTEHGGISRYEKFKIYHKEFLGEEIDENKVNELADQFSNLVFEGVVNSPYVPGIKSFIESQSKKYRFSIISGTPMVELEKIVKEIRLDSHFHEIYGSPIKKPEWSRKILSENNLNKEETLFVGDAVTDWNAAKEVGLHFLFRETDECMEFFTEFEGIRARDFENLEDLLKEFNS